MEKGNRLIAIEIKCSTSPQLEKGFWNAQKFLNPTKSFVIALVDSTFPGKNGVTITNLNDFLKIEKNL